MVSTREGNPPPTRASSSAENPYGASHVAGQGELPVDDVTRQAVKHETERVLSVASKLIAGS